MRKSCFPQISSPAFLSPFFLWLRPLFRGRKTYEKAAENALHTRADIAHEKHAQNLRGRGGFSEETRISTL
jgi:hypothetical protein